MTTTTNQTWKQIFRNYLAIPGLLSAVGFAVILTLFNSAFSADLPLLLKVIFAYAVVLAVLVLSLITRPKKHKPDPKKDKVFTIIVITWLTITLGLVAYLFVAIVSLVYFFGNTNDTPYLTSIQNPCNSNETMHANIVLGNAETVSAQVDLFATIRLYPDYGFRSETNIGNSSLPSTLLMIFDGANCQHDSDSFLLSNACTVRIHLNNGIYTPSHSLMYPSSGSYNIFLSPDTANPMEFTKSDDRFIQVDSYQVTREKTNFFIIVILTVSSVIVGAIVTIWAARRRFQLLVSMTENERRRNEDNSEQK